MDDLDHRLIAELRVNARATVPILANAGFALRLKDTEPTDRIRGVMIELEARNVKSVVAALRKNPGFSGLHTTNGLWDCRNRGR
jgi:hypothetical protein